MEIPSNASQRPERSESPEVQLRQLEERLRMLAEQQERADRRFAELQERMNQADPYNLSGWRSEAGQETATVPSEAIAAHEATAPIPIEVPPPSARPAGVDEKDSVEAEDEDSGDGRGRMALWEHLEELRWVLLKSLCAIVVCATLGLFFSDRIQAVLLLPIEHANAATAYAFDLDFQERPAGLGAVTPSLQVTMHPSGAAPVALRYDEPGSAFMVSLKIGLFGGGFLALPLVVYFLWSFVAPGLREKERRFAVKAAAAAILLFLFGTAFGYAFLYFGIPAMAGFAESGVVNLWSYESYLSFSFMLLLAFGIAFELPLVVLALVRLGVVTTRTLAKLRPYVIVAILIVAGILTPPDVISQVSMALPMWALFELSLLCGRRYDPPPEPDDEDSR